MVDVLVVSIAYMVDKIVDGFLFGIGLVGSLCVINYFFGG